jgi:hypothetical protein
VLCRPSIHHLQHKNKPPITLPLQLKPPCR